MSIRTIQTNGTITADGMLLLQIPTDIASGEHRLVIIIDEQPLEQSPVKRELPVIHVGTWPENLSLRREDLYDDAV